MFSAMFDEDKKLKVYIPVLVFLGAAIVNAFFYTQYLNLVNELLYEQIAVEFGTEFILWLKGIMASQGTIAVISAAVSTIIMPFVIAFYQACVVMLVCKAFFKSEIGFKRSYVFMLYVNMVSTIGSALTIIMSVLMSSATNFFALSVVMDYNPASFAYNLLSSITVFSIFEFVLIFMGINYYSKLEGNKGKIAAAVCICIMLAVTVGFAFFATGDPADTYRFFYETYLKNQ